MIYLLKLTKAIGLSGLIFTLLACGSGSGSSDNSIAVNTRPIANAGVNQVVPTESQVLLNGSSSYDQDNDPLSFTWSVLEAPLNSQASLINAGSFNPTFTADLPGDYVIVLIVNDQVIDSLQDTVMISATENNIAPIANAGPDQNVLTNSTVILDGNDSSDANQDPLTFLWTISSSPLNSNITLSNTDEPSTSFIPDEDGSYVLSLQVNDGQTQSLADEVVIVSATNNTAPIANAGADQNVLTGVQVTLDGTMSSDADLDTLTYQWSSVSSPSGSSSSISNSSSVSATIITDIDGIYEFQLSVSDGQLVHSDNILVTSTSLNTAPIANAGPDQQVTTGSLVTLDGSSSRDDDNDPLTFTWQLVSTPNSSSAVLNSTTATSPTFTADEDGTYLVQLRVSDGSTISEIDAISITSASSNSSLIDQFDGVTPLLTTINNLNALPDISKDLGRYHANVTDNANNITLHFNEDQGRLDATLVSFPFEFIARNIGIGRQDNSQVAPAHTGSPFLFAGVQVHALNLESANSSHVVVGHRGGTGFTIEGKNTLNGASSVNDIGEDEAPLGRADIRIVGETDRSLTVYWQTPNLSPTTVDDSWSLYRTNGSLPGTAPSYGSSVYVGLITYAFGNTGIPFVGTCDSIEIK